MTEASDAEPARDEACAGAWPLIPDVRCGVATLAGSAPTARAIQDRMAVASPATS